MLALALVLLVPTSALAQTDPLWSLTVVRCAIGGQHQEGCLFPTSGPGTSAPQGEAPPDPTPVPEPDPVPESPPPPSGKPAVPTQLADTGMAVTYVHDGLLVEWFTLRFDGAYYAHANSAARSIAYTLPAGSYQATVQACGPAGCTTSAALTVQR
jgi:hypothetical protein